MAPGSKLDDPEHHLDSSIGKFEAVIRASSALLRKPLPGANETLCSRSRSFAFVLVVLCGILQALPNTRPGSASRRPRRSSRRSVRRFRDPSGCGTRRG